VTPFARACSAVIDEQLAIRAAAKLRPDIHALQFAILAAKKLDPAATRRRAVNPQHAERHAFPDQSLHAEAVPALRRVERLQMGLQFVDQKQGVGGVGTLSAVMVASNWVILPCKTKAVKR
jgi:hypothetical protein